MIHRLTFDHLYIPIQNNKNMSGTLILVFGEQRNDVARHSLVFFAMKDKSVPQSVT